MMGRTTRATETETEIEIETETDTDRDRDRDSTRDRASASDRDLDKARVRGRDSDRERAGPHLFVRWESEEQWGTVPKRRYMARTKIIVDSLDGTAVWQVVRNSLNDRLAIFMQVQFNGSESPCPSGP